MSDNFAMNIEREEVPEQTNQPTETELPEYKAWDEQPTSSTVVQAEPLLPWLQEQEITELQSRWNAIQGKFVDEPRTSVEQADLLVTEVLKRIEQVFANHRAILENQKINHEENSTEDLRIALQSYRSFLNRLLAL